MISQVREYFTTLSESFGDGWNRFWFTPSDPLSLCVMRVLTGLVSLVWLATFTPDLDRYFGPQGWLPVEMVRQLEAGGQTVAAPLYRPSYLDYISKPSDLMAIHVAGLVVLGLFTVGLLTRITSVLALIVVLSYVHRAPMLTTQLEPIVTLVLFYLCFGPSGACLSVDRWLRWRKSAKAAVVTATSAPRVEFSTGATIATRLIQVHLAMIYGVMGFSQLMGDTWWSGMGMWWLITRQESRLLDLTSLRAYPFVIEAWSHATVAVELAFAVLIWNKLARPLLLLLAAIMLVGLAIVTGQTLFVSMMLIASLAYVSPAALRACCAACGRRSAALAEK